MVERHYYSWDDNFSTDPERSDVRELTTAKGWEVLCNGIPQERVLCCLTGEGGFVKKCRLDNSGRTLAAGYSIIHEFLMGTVELRNQKAIDQLAAKEN